ncbi:MAG: four helix bundle protein [Gemmataceae bacterium]|nr:four helix bundle protein [Gemmataceae bacterium]
MAVQHYRELIVWQKAIDLVEAVYRFSRRFPRDEIFGLTSQLRRAAVSVPSNIAEGQGRDTTREFLHFLSIARGSLQETATQVIIAERLSYGTPEQIEEIRALCAEVGRLLHGLCKGLVNKP